MTKSSCLPSWNKFDTTWSLSLYGSAIGAGILYLPISAGLGGLLSTLLIITIALPITFLVHRNCARFIFASKKYNSDFPSATEEYFGKFIAQIITGLYAFAIITIIILYGISLTNNLNTIIQDILNYKSPHRGITSFIIAVTLILCVSFGKNIMIKIMSMLVIPLILCLIIFSFFLIPQWQNTSLENLSILYAPPLNENKIFIHTLWYALPGIVFTFGFFSALSPFINATKEKYNSHAEKKYLIFYLLLLLP